MKASVLTGLIILLALSQAALAAEDTPEQQAEKDALKACEVKICDIVASRDPMGEDVTCHIVMTWSEADIVEALDARIDWPWGSAMCRSNVKLERRPIARAMSEAAYEMILPVQTMHCSLSQKKEGDPFVIEFSVAPKIKFENGKASEAQVNWGKASAPALLYPLIYAAAALDNSANMLGPEVVRLVNDFTAKRCAQVKAELPSK